MIRNGTSTVPITGIPDDRAAYYIESQMPALNTKAPQILVIEDDDSLAQMIQCALSEEGFSSVVTPNGTEALTLATDPSIGAVLCDLRLLGMNGLEVIQSLSTSHPHREGGATAVD